jgi:prolyl 4-hydroxylase
MKRTDVATLRDLAGGGDPRAMTALGRWLVFDEAQAGTSEGIALLNEAALRGDAEAASQLAVLNAWGVAVPRSWDGALDFLQRAAELGSTASQRELRFLAQSEDGNWSELRRRVNVSAWKKPRPSRVLSEAPNIRVIEGFATPDECEWLIRLARDRLRRARIYRKDGAGHVEADSRTNSEADYTIGNADVVLALIVERIAMAVGLSPRLFEVAKLLRYEPGQHFGPHCDFQQPTTPALAQEIMQHGQRIATALVYLNDDYSGGETEFPRIGLRFKASRGDALLFANVKPSGALDYDTLHAGLPPTRGVKWVLSQWIRERPVPGR